MSKGEEKANVTHYGYEVTIMLYPDGQYMALFLETPRFIRGVGWDTTFRGAWQKACSDFRKSRRLRKIKFFGPWSDEFIPYNTVYSEL